MGLSNEEQRTRETDMSKAIRIKKDANNSIDGVMEVYRAFEGSERLNLTITRVGRGDYVCAWKSIGYWIVTGKPP